MTAISGIVREDEGWCWAVGRAEEWREDWWCEDILVWLVDEVDGILKFVAVKEELNGGCEAVGFG
jgi:hypothetical protein